MKTITFKTALLAISIFIFQFSNAQKVYVGVNVGYALPLGGQISSSNTTSSSFNNFQTGESGRTTTYESVNSSLGQGMNFGGVVGYMFNKNIGLELDLNYLMGNQVSIEDKDTYTETDFTGSTTTSTENYLTTISSNQFQVTPTLVVSTGFDKFNPYAKFGFVMGFGKVVEDYENTASNYASSSMTQEYSGGLALGFKGSFGAEYALNDKVALFSELNFTSLSYAPKKAEITKYEVDGVDELPNLSTRYKETEFEKEYTNTYTNGQPSDNDAPSKTTKINLPFNNVGLNLGVKFNF